MTSKTSMQYVRDHYGVPAALGGRVIYTGGGKRQHGTITGACSGYLLIRLYGESGTGRYHPTWKLEYLDDE